MTQQPLNDLKMIHDICLEKIGTTGRTIESIRDALLAAQLLGRLEALNVARDKAQAFIGHHVRDQRTRFTLADMQAMMRATANAIVSDIEDIDPATLENK